MSGDIVYREPGYRSRLIASLRRYAERPALRDGSVEWSYAQLEQRLRELCAGLAQAGLRRGDGVGLLGRNTLDYAALQLAVPLTGMYFMSLYELESTQQHVAQVEYGELRAVVVDPVNSPGRAGELAQALGPDFPILTLGPAEAGQDIFALAARGRLERLRVDPDPVQILELGLTGGTTGAPKAIVDNDTTYMNQSLIHVANYELPDYPRMLLSTPLSHGIGRVALKTMLLLGGSVVLQPKFDEERVLATVERERVNSLLLVPSQIYQLLDCDDLDKRDLSSLETLLYGGSPMAPARVRQALERFGRVLVQQYGGQEAKVVSTLSKVDHDPDRPHLLGSAGQPCIGVELAIMDPDMRILPAGEMGEICTRSPASVPCYWKNEEETKALHRGGWVHSGDLGVMDDRGYVTLKDRLKQIIISGGHNVVPRDIEDALVSHPGIRSAAVFGVPDPRWGESVKAVVVVRSGAAVVETELMEFVKSRLGPVNTPKSIDFVPELPLTTAGKVDKKQLRRPYWEDHDRSVG
ncbi:AMP-binding protein [Rhodococcus sp. 14C212]|uniref:AMP-binding protein n=1 Tax=Rhodococcus sp. 14C212 TaxID=2711209 RepID=UPI0013EBB1B3|nr:AMP-binding protein [Rhodococcus sp. 14C212]NGP07408.1 AMP-binding protein [Rhodococcus sp. 14C212]